VWVGLDDSHTHWTVGAGVDRASKQSAAISFHPVALSAAGLFFWHVSWQRWVPCVEAGSPVAAEAGLAPKAAEQPGTFI
jgi:hypothetical protein